MGITIKLDANADATKKMLGDVKASIREVKEDARDAGKALESALGGPEVAAAAKKLDAVAVAAEHAAEATVHLDGEQRRNTSTMQAADNVMDGRHNRFTNEVRLLEQIRGPLLRYESDLNTLDRLMEKGTITASEYANQVEKLNVQLEKSHPTKGWDSTAGTQYGPTFDPAKAGMGGGGPDAGGGLGGAAATLGIAVGVGAAVAGVKELAFAILDSSEAYDKMENSVRKFTDANHTVDDVIKTQREIGKEIRTSTTDAIGLYDRVNATTKDLYFTEQKRVDITKELGLAAIENSRSIETVEAAVKRMAFATETGTISTRELKSLFNTMPELSRELAVSFGMSEKALVSAMSHGKIGVREFWEHIAALLPASEEKVKEFTTEGEQRFRNWYLEAHTNVGGVKTEYEQWIETQKKAKEELAQQALEVKRIDDALAEFRRGLQLTEQAAEMMFSDALTNRMKKFGQEVVDARNKANNLGAQSAVLGSAAALGLVPSGEAVETQRDYTKAVEEAKFSGESYGKTMHDLVDRADTLKNKIEDLRAGMASGKLTNDEYNLAAKELAQTLKSLGEGAGSAVEKMEDRLLKPFRQYALELRAIQDLQARMPQYADLWGEELEKIQAKNPGMLLLEATIKRHVAAYDAAAKAAADWRRASGDDLANRPGFLFESSFYGNDDPLAQREGGERVRNDALRDAKAAQAVYDEGQLKIEKEADRIEKSRLATMIEFQDVAQPYRDEVVKLKLAQNELGLSDEQLASDVEKLRDKYNDMKTPMEVYSKGLVDAKAKLDANIYSAEGYANKLRELREAAGIGTLADGAHDALQNIKKDSADSKLGLELATTGFNDLNAGVMNLVESKGSLRDWFSSTISGFAALIEKALAAKLILAAFGGSSSMDVGMGGIAALALPGHATGGSWIQGGSGGTDSQVAAFRVTPGERITVETPEQQGRSAQQGGGSGGSVSIKNVVGGDRRALIDFMRSAEGKREVINIIRGYR